MYIYGTAYITLQNLLCCSHYTVCVDKAVYLNWIVMSDCAKLLIAYWEMVHWEILLSVTIYIVFLKSKITGTKGLFIFELFMHHWPYSPRYGHLWFGSSWRISLLKLLHITCLLDIKLTNLWGLGVSVKIFQELIKGSRWLAKTIKAKTNQSMIQSRSTYCFVIWSTINQMILFLYPSRKCLNRYK